VKVKCPVIEDLLPLYIDEVCSEESKIIIEEHIKECKLCGEKLRAQKKEITVDKNIIDENLKSKEPFKRIKKSHRMRVVVILVIIPLLFLSLIEIRGDGVGFSALYGRYKAEVFLSFIENGKLESAAREMTFTGGIYGKIEDRDEAKKQWVNGMEQLKKDGIEIIAHRQNRIVTNDTFTSGYVSVTVRYKKKNYDFLLFISTNNGKIEPGSISPDITSTAQEPSEEEKMLIVKISEVISTFNPG
jgi:hypothetical protein